MKVKNRDDVVVKKTGRPSSYTAAVGAEICKLISEGNTMRSVCLSPGMPTRETLMRWADAVPEFRSALACARSDAADWHIDQGLKELRESKGLGKDFVATARELAKYHLSLARVIDPKRYSERIEVEHTGNTGMGAIVVQVCAAPVLPAATESPAIDVIPFVNIGQIE